MVEEHEQAPVQQPAPLLQLLQGRRVGELDAALQLAHQDQRAVPVGHQDLRHAKTTSRKRPHPQHHQKVSREERNVNAKAKRRGGEVTTCPFPFLSVLLLSRENVTDRPTCKEGLLQPLVLRGGHSK